MKTAVQELLQVESDLTRMFDSDLRVAMWLLEHLRANKSEILEKEKELFGRAYQEGLLDGLNHTPKDYYNETFNTNEK